MRKDALEEAPSRPAQGVASLPHPNQAAREPSSERFPGLSIGTQHRRHLRMERAREALEEWGADAEAAGCLPTPEGWTVTDRKQAVAPVVTYIKVLPCSSHREARLWLSEMRRQGASGRRLDGSSGD